MTLMILINKSKDFFKGGGLHHINSLAKCCGELKNYKARSCLLLRSCTVWLGRIDILQGKQGSRVL
uniref:Macaca fascicularis brain cDNA clone: QflA-20687, similar to human Nedd4 binding protein 2 (N4BP2), mRNA, RefSeq: NM_018177.2 n=1 Tax=Macaca fascicularis TaxID=9541 RepID=I7GIK9_MACFA|nr:unnamed protein product [Macaca fascicularis]